MIINQKTFFKNEKTLKQKQTQFLKTETEANNLANPQAITKTQLLKTETEIKISDTHKNNNTITHTQTQALLRSVGLENPVILLLE